MKQEIFERIVIAITFLIVAVMGLTIAISRLIICYCFSALTDKFCTYKHKK
jgi:hypothetical protein